MLLASQCRRCSQHGRSARGVATFAEGAWITMLVFPDMIILLRAIRRYSDRLEGKASTWRPLDLE